MGYRTNSSKAIKFRQRATSVLKNYIQNNYVINSEKITNDRFLIIDKNEVYHLGASIKDLGKKWFAFSKFDIKSFDILKRLN